jgi:16S rRNA processing protein RimM
MAAPDPLPDPHWVRVALLVRPRGLKGELVAEILTDFPERFAERRRLFLRAAGKSDPRPLSLEAHRFHQGRVLLKFHGIDSVEAAEPLRGHEVVIPRAERAQLEPDAVYIGDLAGCALYDRSTGGVVGEIVDVDRASSSTPLIVVQPEHGAELLIPFAKAYLPHIDLAGRRMEMTLPEGLLTLNDPLPVPEGDAATQGEKPSVKVAPAGPRRKRR